MTLLFTLQPTTQGSPFSASGFSDAKRVAGRRAYQGPTYCWAMVEEAGVKAGGDVPVAVMWCVE
jgi:hypothetical protein